jgi:aconitate hydratase
MEFQTIARVDSPVEVDYLKHGGILQMVLRNLLKDKSGRAAVTA